MTISKLYDREALISRFNVILRNNSGSIVRTIVYTIGHFIIAATCVWYFTGTNFLAAITDAIVEPIINAIWYFLLDRYWVTRIQKNKTVAD